MGKLISLNEYKGSVGDLTAYRLPGVDGIVVRRKGGVTKEQVAHDPRFDNTRRLNKEFSGRAKVVSRIAQSLKPVSGVADYPYAASLNALLKKVQELDTLSPFGERSITLSQHPAYLSGFSLNRTSTLERIIVQELSVQLSRSELKATVAIPELIPGVNLFVPAAFPWFRIELAIGIVPDFHFVSNLYQPTHTNYLNSLVAATSTSWSPAVSVFPGADITVKLNFLPPDECFVVIVGLVTRFGRGTRETGVEQVRRAGAGKIIRVG